MECVQIQELMSAWLDGELPVEEAARLEAHLDGCSACLQVRDTLRNQHLELRRLFVERRQAAAVLAENVNQQIRQEAPPRPRNRWLPLLFAAAAGFLVAVVIFQPWRRAREVIVAPQRTEAHQGDFSLIVAREPIDIQLPGRSDWEPVKAGQRFEAGCKVRTKADLCCEIRTGDDSEIRLNGGTEVCFQSTRHLELASGQMMAHVAKRPTPFQVNVAATIVTAVGTEFDITCRPAETTLLVLEGSTSVAGKGPNQIVLSGELAKIVNGQITEKNAAGPLLLLLTTRWVNEILVLKGRDNPELARRIDDILAQIGQLKGSFMDEQEIRGLGDRCLLPLSRYLQSPRCEGESQRGRRQMAARILSDMALPWAIPELIELLDKDDPEVRFQAAKGLQRLTSVNMGHPPEEWRRNSREIMLPAIKSWQQWWRQNQYRCPAGP